MSARREGSAGQQVLPVAACLNLPPFAWVTFPCCTVRLRQCWFLPLTGNMDFSKEGCRFYTFTRWKLEKKQQRSEGSYCKFFSILLHHLKLFPAGFELSQSEKLCWMISIALDVLGHQ